MDPPWRGHIDSLAKSLIKTKVRVRTRTLGDIETTVNSAKINKSLQSTTSMRSVKSQNVTNQKNVSKKDTRDTKPIKEEREISVVHVDPHNKYDHDPLIESLRKEKELEKKQKILQLQKLKEIQEEEELQRKQVKKLQAEMKTKPFI